MKREQFIKLRGHEAANDALQLRDWVAEAVGLERYNIREVAEHVEGGPHVVACMLPGWVHEAGADFRSLPGEIAHKCHAELAHALFVAARDTVVEYEVTATVSVNGEVFSTQHYCGNWYHEAVEAVELLADEVE